MDNELGQNKNTNLAAKSELVPSSRVESQEVLALFVAALLKKNTI